jgi:hypothetical protein
MSKLTRTYSLGGPLAPPSEPVLLPKPSGARPSLPAGWMTRSETPSRRGAGARGAANGSPARPASASPHGRGAGARGSSASRRPSPPRKPLQTLRARLKAKLAKDFEFDQPHLRGVPSRGHNLKREKNHGPSKLSKTRKASSKNRSK